MKSIIYINMDLLCIFVAVITVISFAIVLKKRLFMILTGSGFCELTTEKRFQLY